MKLNAEQQKLAADNYQLIYGYLSKYNLDEEEYLDILMIALCKAACSYDKEKGSTFGTYAFQCMYNEVNHYLRVQTAKMRIPPYMIVSYDEFIPNADGDEEVTYKDRLVDEKSDKYMGANLMVNDMMAKLKPQEQEIVKYLDYGYSQSDISEIMGISKQRVSTIVIGIRNKLQPFLVQ